MAWTPVPEWGLLDPQWSNEVDDEMVLMALVAVEQNLTHAWLDIDAAPDWVSAITLDFTSLDTGSIVAGNRAGGNPVIPLVPQLRAQAEAIHAGAGDWVHRGATSQDILDTALMLVASHARRMVLESLQSTAATLAALAEDHRHSLMVGRTLTQHAAPITFGVKAASWLDGIEAALEALASLTLPVQLAGSVGTGAAFADLAASPEASERLREALAARLDLSDSGRSWQAERSPVTAAAATFALVLGTLGRVAADILVLSRTEIGEITEASGGSSSAMPQKQNPTAAVVVRAAALQAPGLVSTVFAALVTEDERPSGSWHSEWLALRSLLRLALESAETAAVLVSSLDIDTDRMHTNLESAGGLAWAEPAQSQLTPRIGRAAANAIVVRAIAAVTPELSFRQAVLADGHSVDLSPARVFVTTDLVIDDALERHRLRSAR